MGCGEWGGVRTFIVTLFVRTFRIPFRSVPDERLRTLTVIGKKKKNRYKTTLDFSGRIIAQGPHNRVCSLPNRMQHEYENVRLKIHTNKSKIDEFYFIFFLLENLS